MKALLTVALLGAFTSLSYGQGTVNFSAGASPSTRITVWPGGTNMTGAGNFYFALFVAPVATGTNYGLSSSLDPTANGFTYVSDGTNTASAGRMSGNTSTDGYVIVPGYAAGASAEFVVVGWSANIGLSWNAFHNFINGSGGPVLGPIGGNHSLVADRVQLGGGLIPTGNIFGQGVGQIPGFTIYFFPEPSVAALVLTALAAWKMHRVRRHTQRRERC